MMPYVSEIVVVLIYITGKNLPSTLYIGSGGGGCLRMLLFLRWRTKGHWTKHDYGSLDYTTRLCLSSPDVCMASIFYFILASHLLIIFLGQLQDRLLYE